MHANKIRKEKAYIDKILNNNFRILKELLYKENEGIFLKQYLLGKGYDFRIHTHYDNYQNKRHNAIYKYLIIPTDNDKIKIVKYDRFNNNTNV